MKTPAFEGGFQIQEFRLPNGFFLSSFYKSFCNYTPSSPTSASFSIWEHLHQHQNTDPLLGRQMTNRSPQPRVACQLPPCFSALHWCGNPKKVVSVYSLLFSVPLLTPPLSKTRDLLFNKSHGSFSILVVSAIFCIIHPSLSLKRLLHLASSFPPPPLWRLSPF